MIPKRKRHDLGENAGARGGLSVFPKMLAVQWRRKHEITPQLPESRRALKGFHQPFQGWCKKTFGLFLPDP